MKTNRSRHTLTLLVASPLLMLAACEDKTAPTSQTTPDSPSSVLGKTAKMARDVGGDIAGSQASAMSAAEAITGEGNAVALAGVSIPVPSAWPKSGGGGGGGSMSPAAEFSIAGQDGPARLVFFNTGGSADANIQRWKGQMKEGGQPAPAKVETKNAGGVKITTIEMEGTYSGMGPGGAPAAPADDTGFLGAIVEGPRGQVQIRMTGPYRTVREAKPLWTAMINGIATGR